jgi:hypothetical protein
MAEKKKRAKVERAAPARGEAAAPARAEVKTSSFLERRSEARSELRFLPRNGPAAAISVLAMSLGALAVGAGVYGKFLRDAAVGSHPWSTWLLVGGAVAFGAAALLGAMPAMPARVGDAGVGVERGGDVDRLAWFEVDSVGVTAGALVVRGARSSLSLKLSAHPEAAARIVAEAKRRIPAKVGDVAGVPSGASGGEGSAEKLALEPLQLAGARCAASDRIIALDKDGRLCGRCGQRYHKDAVPKACVSCEAPLA